MADAADAVTMARFDAPDLDVHLKADATHVSESDTAAERAIRGILEAELPDDAILGEEYGTTGDSNRTWIIDPIDGTANYVKGIPMWSTLIALAVDGVPRVGVVSQPAIGRRWWAAEGTGAWTTTSTGEQRQIHVSDVDDLATASISFQSLQQWEEADRLEDLLALRRTVWRDRAYGDAWPYMLLAEGRLRVRRRVRRAAVRHRGARADHHRGRRPVHRHRR